MNTKLRTILSIVLAAFLTGQLGFSYGSGTVSASNENDYSKTSGKELAEKLKNYRDAIKDLDQVNSLLKNNTSTVLGDEFKPTAEFQRIFGTSGYLNKYGIKNPVLLNQDGSVANENIVVAQIKTALNSLQGEVQKADKVKAEIAVRDLYLKNGKLKEEIEKRLAHLTDEQKKAKLNELASALGVSLSQEQAKPEAAPAQTDCKLDNTVIGNYLNEKLTEKLSKLGCAKQEGENSTLPVEILKGI